MSQLWVHRNNIVKPHCLRLVKSASYINSLITLMGSPKVFHCIFFKGSGIWNQTQGPIWYQYRSRFFVSETKTFFSNFSHFFPLLGWIQVLISLKTQILKNDLKASDVGGSLLWWKKTSCYQQLNYSFKIYIQ